jgi:hypothetical protein
MREREKKKKRNVQMYQELIKISQQSLPLTSTSSFKDRSAIRSSSPQPEALYENSLIMLKGSVNDPISLKPGCFGVEAHGAGI